MCMVSCWPVHTRRSPLSSSCHVLHTWLLACTLLCPLHLIFQIPSPCSYTHQSLYNQPISSSLPKSSSKPTHSESDSSTSTKMVLKKQLSSLVLLVFTLFLLSVATEDPELRQCKHQCTQQRQFDERQKEHCERQCEQYHKEKHERERGKGGEGEESISLVSTKDPEGECRRCRERCQKEEGGRREHEERGGKGRRAERKEREGEEFERGEREREEWVMKRREGRGEEEEEEEEEGEGEGRNPYVFELEDFRTIVSSENGRFSVLPKFTERSKKLFKVIENFRVGVVEAEPRTFILPQHSDAARILFVAKGRGTVTVILPDRRQSFNVECGHILTIPAGAVFYTVNSDDNEKLIVATLILPVATPGNFEAFFGVGGENPESFFRAFSTEVLEAIFKTSRETLRRVFKEQKDGVFREASREQIRALSQHEEGGGKWPFGGGGSKGEEGPLNIFKQRPTHSNKHGKLIEVDSDDFKQLRELPTCCANSISISFANISQGSMHAPYYNSKATKISIVTRGRGYFEMACPHVSSGSHEDHHGRQRERGGKRGGSPVHYEKISSELKRGSLIVVPAGHPYVAMASHNKNLELLSFEINSDNNFKVHLAGKDNVLKHLEREAKELSFGGAPVEVVDRILRSQDAYFFEGPRHQQRGRAEA